MSESNLLLLGHGSHLDARSSATVHAIASHIRGLDRFRRTDVAFWKEEPAVSRWSDRYRVGDTVVAVPVFISDGYFTREVLPRELGLAAPTPAPYGERDDKLVRECVRGIDLRYTPPVGSHAALAEVARRRASEAGAGREDAVAILGHGTRRNPHSERNVFAQAAALRERREFAEVVTVFMDQEPMMAQVFELTAAARVFMVPMFIADGWHVGQTIPEGLALEGSELRRGGRRLIYTPPVGTHSSVADVVLSLAEEAMA
jgi:sirohydrochlorin cobaltochelatase